MQKAVAIGVPFDLRVDMSGWSFWTHGSRRGIVYLSEMARVLQAQYPETLQHATIKQAPALFQSVWRILRVFLDARTVDKITFE
jgi:hypothetical protein